MGGHFVDEAVIQVRSGRGGDGCCSFRREKFAPFGGPDGGDGGRGGDVILRASPHITTLLDIGRRYEYAAADGRPGGIKNCSGKDGEDLTVDLPVGTIVRDAATRSTLADLDRIETEIIIARGGSGGRGNKAFATATHQAPREWEPGGAAFVRELALELKLMADVGFLGLPNAGKSTLLARISAARPRIAEYPFTTLAPQLGVTELPGERRLVCADIPGLIEGAHKGAGLGIGFLRHLGRTRALVHLLDPYDKDVEQIYRDYEIIRGELRSYASELAARPTVVVINKIDLIPAETLHELHEGLSRRVGAAVHLISGVTGAGVPELLEMCWRLTYPDLSPAA